MMKSSTMERSGEITTDALQQRLVAIDQAKSRITAEELGLIEELDSRQVHTADGCRTMGEWVSRILDTTMNDARDLVRTMRRTVDRPDLREALADGVSFRRVEALSKIPEDVGLLEEQDVASVFRLAARKARLTAADEVRSVDDRFLVMQPTLDRSWFRIWGGVDGVAGEVIDKTLTTMGDQEQLPEGHGHLGTGWRKATGLLDLCLGKQAPRSDISVFITATEAAQTNGDAGVVLASGAKIGRRTVEAILCGGTTQVFGITAEGEYMRYGRKYRLATAAQTKALMHKYGGRCAADGCDSRNRLQAHHVDPWAAADGETNLEDLILLCWFHHHVVVHQWGYQIYHHPNHRRIRFRQPQSRAP